MKRTTILGFLLSISTLINAQENNKNQFAISLSIGPSFSNFIHSKAPHAGYIIGDDITTNYDAIEGITNNSGYEADFFQDMRTGISTGIQVEYFLGNDFSILSGLDYTSKGIHLYRSKSFTKNEWSPYPTQVSHQEKKKIKNEYLSLPVSVRKYFFKRRCFFVDAGIYVGYLASSSISFEQHHTQVTEPDFYSTSNFKSEFKDVDRTHTHRFDLGLSAGAGVVKSISKRVVIKAEVLANIGMIQVDSKNNNEFSVTPFVTSTGYSYLVHSANYYGFNSNAKNFNFAIRLGIGYRLGK